MGYKYDRGQRQRGHFRQKRNQQGKYSEPGLRQKKSRIEWIKRGVQIFLDGGQIDGFIFNTIMEAVNRQSQGGYECKEDNLDDCVIKARSFTL